MMDFTAAFGLYRDEINLLSTRQGIPGMDADDVANEMLVCLWKACQTYDPQHGITFGAYWWSVWTNRKINLLASYHAPSRPRAVLVPDPAVLDRRTCDVRLPPEPPAGASSLERVVWELLASGERGTSVRTLTEMSKRRYYDLLRTWRTDEVRDSLVLD